MRNSTKHKNEALEESEKRLLRLVECDPDNALAWYELGQVHMDLGQYGKANECFKEALAIQPGNDFFKKAMIEALVFLGDNESAEQAFLELAGKSNEREDMLLRDSKFLHAERRSLKKVTFDMTGDTANLDTWLSAAEALLREGKLKEAEAAAVVGVHAAKVEDAGTFMGFWNVIGRIMHAMNRHRGEANAFLVPFSMDYQSAAAASLAEALIECGEDDQAQRVLEKAVEEGTQVGQVYMCLGRRYWDIDRRRDAARMYRRGTELEPQNTHWSLGYISLLLDTGELDDAEKEIERVKTLDDGARWADYYTQVVKDRREELSGDLVIVRKSRDQLPRLIRDSGFIVDWVHREVEGVQVVQANLCTASRAGRVGHYAVTGMCVSVRGRDLQLIRHQVEEGLQKRAFMYHDYEVDLRESDGLTREVLLYLKLRPRKYLTKKYEHAGRVPPEFREYIEALLSQVTSSDSMDYWAKSFVNAECKCEQLKLALRMIDLALTCEGHVTEEMIAAEECLRSLSDLRVGAALLWLWQNRDSYRRVWRSRSLELSQLHSQIREWFEDVRQAPCYDLCLADAVPDGADTESVATEGDAEDWLSKITRVPETDEMPNG